MSDMFDKLTPVRPSQGGKAHATRKQLLARRGSAQLSPERIEIDTMGGVEVWHCVGGDVFEQQVRS